MYCHDVYNLLIYFQDLFWWYFLEKYQVGVTIVTAVIGNWLFPTTFEWFALYNVHCMVNAVTWIFVQPNRNIQEMLFNRIAHNYVKMLFTAPVTQYRDKFLKVGTFNLPIHSQHARHLKGKEEEGMRKHVLGSLDSSFPPFPNLHRLPSACTSAQINVWQK